MLHDNERPLEYHPTNQILLVERRCGPLNHRDVIKFGLTHGGYNLHKSTLLLILSHQTTTTTRRRRFTFEIFSEARSSW
jgi:hypothetical protein